MKPRKKILLVDDDDLLRGIYTNRFHDDGFDVITAKNGREAMEILEKGDIPDIIFTGIIMPEMSGFELISKLKAVPSLADIPVAISSHRGLAEDRKKAQDFGVKDFLIQGETTPNEVSHRIKAILGVQDFFRIEFLPAIRDGQTLIGFINRQQGTTCDSVGGRNVVLELRPKETEGEFEVRLVC